MKKSGVSIGGVKLLAVLLLLALGLPGPARAGKVESFSGDYVMSGPGMPGESVGKIYYTPDKMRTDQTMPGPMGQVTVIYLKKEKKMIMISQARKAWVEMDIDESQWPGLTDVVKDKEKKKLGAEKVSGYECTKYAVVKVVNLMGQNQEVKLTTWESDKFEMPLKTQTQEGGLQEIRNIKEGKPSADVFKVPEGYKKAANMMEFMAPGD